MSRALRSLFQIFDAGLQSEHEVQHEVVPEVQHEVVHEVLHAGFTQQTQLTNPNV